MLKWVLGGIAVVSLLAAFLVLRFGLQPRPIRQINPTVFDSLASVGAASFRRVSQDWAATRLVFLVEADDEAASRAVWDGWLKTAQVESGGVTTEVLEIRDLSEAEVARVIEHSTDKIRLVVRLVSGIKSINYLSEQLDKVGVRLNRSPMIVVQQRSVVSAEDISSLGCPEPEDDALLSCIGARYSKIYLRKKLPRDKIVAGMQRHGRSLYVLFVHTPVDNQEQ